MFLTTENINRLCLTQRVLCGSLIYPETLSRVIEYFSSVCHNPEVLPASRQLELVQGVALLCAFALSFVHLTMAGETAPLLLASRSAFKRPNELSLSRVVFLFVLVVLPMFFLSELELPSIEVPWRHEEHGDLCPQVGALHPQIHGELAHNLSVLYDSQNFVGIAAGWLGGAVRVA